MRAHVRSQAGSALLLVIVLSAVFAILTPPLLDFAIARSAAATTDLRRTQAVYLAESGIAEAAAKLATGRLAPGSFDSDSELLRWDAGTYHVTIHSTREGLRVESTGKVGGTSRTVSVTFARRGLIPSETFLPGPQEDGVVSTTPGDPNYLPGYTSPHVAIELPALPTPPANWDEQTTDIGPGTYVFDIIKVTDHKNGLTVRADTGPVEIYVAGYILVSNHCTVTCQGQHPIRFYVLGNPPAPGGWAVVFENNSQLACTTTCAWTLNGGMLIDNHAHFGAIPEQNPAIVPITLNATGDLALGTKAKLGSSPAPDNPPHVLATARSADLGNQASVYAMLLAPSGPVTTGTQTEIRGAVVCTRFKAGNNTFLQWNEAIAQLTEPAEAYGWETPAGNWEVVPGSWEVR